MSRPDHKADGSRPGAISDQRPEVLDESPIGRDERSKVYFFRKEYAEALKAAEKAFAVAPPKNPQIADDLKKNIDDIKAKMAASKK